MNKNGSIGGINDSECDINNMYVSISWWCGVQYLYV